MEADYTKRELDMKFQILADKVDDNHAATQEQISAMGRVNHDKHLEILNFLEEIKTGNTFIQSEVKKTNGRVTKHDTYVKAAAMCIGLLGIIGLLIGYIWQTQIAAFNDRIKTIEQLQK